jgi:hypothetical protein
LESPFSFIGAKLSVDLVGNQEIGGNNQAYLKVEKGIKDDFHRKNNVLKIPSLQILANTEDSV